MNWVYQNCCLMIDPSLRMTRTAKWFPGCMQARTIELSSSRSAQDHFLYIFCTKQKLRCWTIQTVQIQLTPLKAGLFTDNMHSTSQLQRSKCIKSLCHIQPHSCSSDTWQVTCRQNAKHIKNSDDCIHAVSLPCATTQSAQERVQQES